MAPPRSAHPVVLTMRALAVGMAIAAGPAVLWSAALAVNLRVSPSVPWSVLASAGMIALLVMSLRRAPSHRLDGAMDGWRWALPPSDWYYSTVTAAGVIGAGLCAVLVAQRVGGAPQPAVPEMARTSPWLTTMYVGAGSVVAGAFEEVGFRGYLQSRLVGLWGRSFSWCGVAGGFALLHVGQPSFPYVALVYVGTSLALSALVDVCGSVWPGALAHVLVDGASFGMVLSTATAQVPTAGNLTLPDATLFQTLAAGALAALVARHGYRQLDLLRVTASSDSAE